MTLSEVLKANHTIAVTVHYVGLGCYIITEINTGTELLVQGLEQAETFYGSLSTVWANTKKHRKLFQLTDTVGVTNAWLSSEYADTLRDTAIYNGLVA